MPERRILITGASSGIGAALAREYARPGTTLILWGRNEARLTATAVVCRAQGALCLIDCFDIREIAGMTARLVARDAETPIDLAIFCAGVGGSISKDQAAEAPATAEAVAAVDFSAPVVGATTLAGAMAGRRRGQIVLVGSIAESFPLPMAPAYAGAKAGLAMFAEALRIRMADYGVLVTLVSPGFIDTPMSRKVTEPKPFLMPAEHAARIIARRIGQGATRIVVPWQFAVIRALARMLPRRVLGAILRRA